MRSWVLSGAFLIVFAGVVSAQSYNEAAQVDAKTVTISGDVVRYEPGQIIVIRGQDNKEVTYRLSPSIVVPADVQAGTKVTLHTERAADGSATTVSRIVTTSITSTGQVKATTDETRKTASGDVTRTRTTTITGEVVRYEPGQTIVVRGPRSEVVTYTLAPGASVPADVQVGRKVTLHTEQGADGSATLVRRVMTTSVTPEGRTKSTTQETRTDESGATSTTTTTTTSGRVEAYTAGKSITVLRSDGSRVTYGITSQSSVPEGVVIGKTITIVPVDPREPRRADHHGPRAIEGAHRLGHGPRGCPRGPSCAERVLQQAGAVQSAVIPDDVDRADPDDPAAGAGPGLLRRVAPAPADADAAL